MQQSLAFEVTSFVALCGGYVLVADATANRVVLLDLRTGHEAHAFPLTGAPLAMELDASSRTLLILISGTSTLTLLDLDDGTTRAIEIGGQAGAVAAGPPGIAFVVRQDADARDYYLPAVVDLAAAVVVSVATREGRIGWYNPTIAFDPVHSRLFVGDRGLSPSSLARLDYDPTERALALVSEFRSGSNGQDLAVSNDGTHVAFPCGAGNEGGYTISDYAADDFGPDGEWDTGAYPRSAAFSRDDQLLAAFGSELVLFRVDTHAPVWQRGLPECAYASSVDVQWMRDGAGMVVLTKCGFDDESARLTHYAAASAM